jgi:ribonuclease H-related protein
MAKKVYAIRKGYDPHNNVAVENKIVSTWNDCLKYVKGVKGAQYKSFLTIDEANSYLNDGSKLLKKEENKYPKDCLHIYVDGSYNSKTWEYSYGMVAVRNNVVEHIESGAELSNSDKNIRQIAGELEGAVKGVQYALNKGDKKVVIFHDYAGICYHATGEWERREESSKEYYKKMQALMNSGVEVIFVKVDSHTGDLFNELVDEKCKEQLLINSDKVVEKWLLTDTINVSSELIKEEILKIAPKGEENIIIVAAEKNDKLDLVKNNEDKNKQKSKIGEKEILEELNNIVSNLPLDKQLEVLNYAKYISYK